MHVRPSCDLNRDKQNLRVRPAVIVAAADVSNDTSQ